MSWSPPDFHPFSLPMTSPGTNELLFKEVYKLISENFHYSRLTLNFFKSKTNLKPNKNSIPTNASLLGEKNIIMGFSLFLYLTLVSYIGYCLIDPSASKNL